MSETGEVSRRQAWVMAARPQTLPAGASPVIIGTGLAIHDGVFTPVPALFALVGALLIQVGTNLANDYYDAVHGADSPDRTGFTRVTAKGIIDPAVIRRATWATFGLSVIVGLYLVAVGGLPILAVGLLSIAAGVAYTGGPYPFGYHGLGDIFVFVFFGLVAVTGTYYVQAASILAAPIPLWVPAALPPVALVVGLPAAGLSTAILVVNNIRDLESDAAAGKRTLAVTIGYRWSRIEWVSLVTLAYIVPVGLAFDSRFGPPVLLPVVTIPLAARVGHTVLTRTDGEALNPALEATGRLLFVYAVLFAIGLALATP